MKAYVYGIDKKLQLTEIAEPLQRPDNAVIKVKAASICGTDLRTFIHGSTKISPPRVIGHEVCGIREHVGDTVKGFTAGERIIVAPALGCGECYACTRGYTNLCDNLKTLGFDYDGSFAEYMEIPGAYFSRGHVLSVPSSLSDEEAVLTEPVACVVNGQEPLSIKKGEYVVIFGSGFIGSIHAELAFLKGASAVICIEISAERGRKVKEYLPEVQVLVSGKIDLKTEIMRMTQGRGADVVITACSAGAAQRDALQIAAKRGRISLFGGLPGEAVGYLDSNLIHYKELGVFGVHASTAEQNRTVLGWIAEKKLNTGKYVSRLFRLEKIEDAFNALKNETILKAVVKM